jgi:peptidoglycan/xylan/chitin deacetylase (PgdA/CDA1 family)
MPDGVRDLAAESNFEYGSRVGVWRLLDVFAKHDIRTTFLPAAAPWNATPRSVRL